MRLKVGRSAAFCVDEKMRILSEAADVASSGSVCCLLSWVQNENFVGGSRHGFKWVSLLPFGLGFRNLPGAKAAKVPQNQEFYDFAEAPMN